jgi:hypothetical protein
MSAFSRGCLLRHHHALTPRTIHLFFPSKSFQSPRSFSSSPLLLAAKKARPPQTTRLTLPKSKPSFTPTKSAPPSTNAPTYYSYATTLAQKSHPTLLYQAPSQTIFIVSSYSASVFCLSYAAISFWSNYLAAPPDLAAWVPYAFGGISFMMACFGGYLLLGPARLVRTITAVPKHANAVSTAAGKSAGNAAAPSLEIEVELRKMFPLPFFPARKIIAKPEEIVLPMPLFTPPSKALTVSEMRELRLQEEREKKELREYERSHIMTAPFRHASQGFFYLFKAIGRTWSREGFLKLEVKGMRYKLDISGGWALDGGRALDRLTRLKPRL